MSRPPPRRGRKVAEWALERKQQHLDDIRNNLPDAEIKYHTFLVERGDYFYSLEEILPADQIERIPYNIIAADHDGNKTTKLARAFLRTSAPDYLAQGGREGVTEYVTTKKAMMTDDNIASMDSKGHSSNAKKRIWNKDILARPLDEAQDSEVAHLLPDAPAHAIEWYDVACWAMDTDPEKTDWATIFRLLHGTKDSGGKKRTFGTGLRHFVANKVRITAREKLIDKEEPQLLILPIKSRQECLNWNGEDYQAIVLVGAKKDGTGRRWATTALGLKDVENMVYSDATGAELQKALLSLKECTCAMVQSLVNYDTPQVPSNASEDEKNSFNAALELRRKRRDSFLSALDSLGTKSIPVPKEGNSGPNEEHRGICKIWFSNTESESNDLHPAPDPLLLLARSTVVWSVRQNIRLRASAVVQDDYSMSEWENDVLQLEWLNKLKQDRQVQGLEITMNPGDPPQESDIETSSISSGGSLQG